MLKWYVNIKLQRGFIMNSIGAKLKKIRVENNYTQEYIATKLYVTRQTISKWENNKTTPDTTSLKKICEIYDINISYFIPDNEVIKNKDFLFYISLSINIIVCSVLLFNLIQSSFFYNSHSIYTWILLGVLSMGMLINIITIFNKNEHITYIVSMFIPIVILILINNMI